MQLPHSFKKCGLRKQRPSAIGKVCAQPRCWRSEGRNIAVDAPLDQIRQWIQLWIQEPQLHAQVARDWQLALGKLKGQEAQRWRLADGPISGLIATVIDNGWQPLEANRWKDPDGFTREINDDPTDMKRLEAKLRATLWRQQWAKAARHLHGLGLEHGGNADITIAEAKRLRARGRHQEAGLLEVNAAAGLWSAQRLQDSGYVVDEMLCPLCKQDVDTLDHRLWKCCAILQSDSPIVQATNKYAEEAIRGLATHPCYWLRGVLPADWLPALDPAQGFTCAVAQARDLTLPFDAQGRCFYLDESAGAYSSSPCVRRAGWGVAVLEPTSLQLLYGWCGAPAGEVQTQIGAAVEALKFILASTEGDICIAPDCQYVIDGMRNIYELSIFGSYAPQWAEIRSILGTRRGKVTMIKVSAHESLEDYASGHEPLEHWVGNNFADRLAARAAEANAAPLEAIATYESHRGRTVMLARRIVAVHSQFLDVQAEARKKKKRGTKAAIEAAWVRRIQRSGHKLKYDAKGRRAHCLVCMQSVARKVLKSWLDKGQCRALRATANAWLLRPPPLPPRPDDLSGAVLPRGPVVGHKELDASHTLSCLRGFWFCCECGSYATLSADSKSSAKALARPCIGVARRAGRDYLSRFARGLPPRKGMQWPRTST